MSKFVLPGLTLCGILFFTGCSSDTKTASTDDKAPAEAKTAAIEPVSGKTAYWEMYTKARSEFATDLMPLTLEAKEIPGIENTDGKAAMWNATFVSNTKKEARVYTYAIAAHPPDIYKGVTVGKPLPWNGTSSKVMPFSMGQVQVDSDAALKSAAAEAGDWLKKHPEKDPKIDLEEMTKYQLPTWIVKWGNEKLGYVAIVSGVDGKSLTTK
jgi:hypothetical protein